MCPNSISPGGSIIPPGAGGRGISSGDLGNFAPTGPPNANTTPAPCSQPVDGSYLPLCAQFGAGSWIWSQTYLPCSPSSVT